MGLLDKAGKLLEKAAREGVIAGKKAIKEGKKAGKVLAREGVIAGKKAIKEGRALLISFCSSEKESFPDAFLLS